MKSLALVFIFLLTVVATAGGQCPTIQVVGPPGVTNPGDPMVFRVEITNPDLKFSWTVSAGTITEGQGSSRIVVATDKTIAGSNVTATIDVEGLRPDCARRASESAPVDAWMGCGLVMDEWEGLKPNDERSRLDSFFTEIANNPLDRGIIVLELTEKERLDSGNQRLKFVVKHARFRKFDLNTIWFVLDRSGYGKTKVYRVPPGADMLPCDGICITIKGGDLK